MANGLRIRVRCPACVDGVLHDVYPVEGAKPPNLNIAICPSCGVRVQTRFFPDWTRESRVVGVTANGAGHKDMRLANVRASETVRRKAGRAAKPQPPRMAPLPRSKELLIRAGGV